MANVKPSGELQNCRYATRNAMLTPTSERRAVLRVSRSRHPHVIIVGCLESPRSSQRLKEVFVIVTYILSCFYVPKWLNFFLRCNCSVLWDLNSLSHAWQLIR